MMHELFKIVEDSGSGADERVTGGQLFVGHNGKGPFEAVSYLIRAGITPRLLLLGLFKPDMEGNMAFLPKPMDEFDLDSDKHVEIAHNLLDYAAQFNQLNNSSLNYAHENGFNDHGETHVASVTNRLIEYAKKYGLSARDTNLLIMAGVFHDVGNFVDRKGHHEVGAKLITQLVPWLPEKDMKRVKHIIASHDEKVISSFIAEQLIDNQDISDEELCIRMREKFGVMGLLLMLADKEDGLNRSRTPKVQRLSGREMLADPHARICAFTGSSSKVVEHGVTSWEFDFQPTLSTSEGLTNLQHPNKGQIELPENQHLLHRLAGIPYFCTWTIESMQMDMSRFASMALITEALDESVREMHFLFADDQSENFFSQEIEIKILRGQVLSFFLAMSETVVEQMELSLNTAAGKTQRLGLPSQAFIISELIRDRLDSLSVNTPMVVNYPWANIRLLAFSEAGKEQLKNLFLPYDQRKKGVSINGTKLPSKRGV